MARFAKILLSLLLLLIIAAVAAPFLIPMDRLKGEVVTRIEAATGRMPAYVDTGLNLVHVDDVADGHLLALDTGKIGERYILGGQDATLAEISACQAAFTAASRSLRAGSPAPAGIDPYSAPSSRPDSLHTGVDWQHGQ